ncbi:hypothetical protein [Oceanospirillum sediminis]|uniref:Uncharacterized protein n=1 Tax=Oceanospirillum sediminis TaxID=2760088 RepID=A0A839IXF7_9GAMM|nr:hypothetical protein [Oceanospirillum sediminis]MBB1489370.1 hypothetical protein [Oceanospirillum sediminis]
MKQEFFWPIYSQIEKEFIEVSYCINIDCHQLNVYSIKIADLILRTVSECENIAKAICKREGSEFLDKKGNPIRRTYFPHYMDAIDSIFSIKSKLVSFDFDNADENTFDQKLMPFYREKDGDSLKKWSWYDAYNAIKHDRVENYRKANLNNLINAMAALFLLNIYYSDKVVYDADGFDSYKLMEPIDQLSKVFSIQWSIDLSSYDGRSIGDDKVGFFDPVSYARVASEFSTYLISYDQFVKTDSDKGYDFLQQLQSSIVIANEDGSFTKAYEDIEPTDKKTLVKAVARIPRAK